MVFFCVFVCVLVFVSISVHYTRLFTRILTDYFAYIFWQTDILGFVFFLLEVRLPSLGSLLLARWG